VDEMVDPREAAIKRLKAKRGFKTHLAAYVIVNTFLVLMWAVGDRGGFWPFWTIVGWGIGLAFHGWSVYFQAPITEDDVAREMKRGH
jgi:2TM domain